MIDPTQAARTVLLCAAALCPATGTAAADNDAWPIRRMLEAAAITHAVPSPDGDRVAYVVSGVDTKRRAGVPVAHLWVAAADGSNARRFTFHDLPVSAPGWSPDGRWLAYLEQSPAGDRQLMLMNANGGAPRRLSDGQGSVQAFQWSPSGSAVALLKVDSPAPSAVAPPTAAVLADRRSGNRGLWRLTVDQRGDPGAWQRLTPKDLHVGVDRHPGAFDWSPDGRHIAFSHTRSAAFEVWKSADISVVDVTSGHIRPFQQSNAAEFAPSYSPDGRRIAFNITVFPPSAVGQWRVGVANTDGSGLKLLAATPDEQPRIVGWISNRTVLVQEPERTVTALWTLPGDGREPRRFDDGRAVLSAVTLNEPATRLAFATSSDSALPEAAVTSLKRFRPQVVSAANAGLPGDGVPATREVTWQTADGREVEGLLTVPAGSHRGSRHPLLLLIHNEPTGVFVRRDPRSGNGVFALATLAARGYAVLRANPRGASGYGHDFRAAGRHGWGTAAYEDLMAGVDHLVAAGVADPDRLAVAGWGHGGFMAAHTVVHSHRFAAAILGAPITDLVQLRLLSDQGAVLGDYLDGEFWEQPAAYRDLSPLLQAQQITTPVLILHGEADPRVPSGQGLALYRALKLQGLDTRMVLYPDAAHRLERPAQRLHAALEVLAWLERHVPAR